MKDFASFTGLLGLLLLSSGCHALAIQKNYDGTLPTTEIAVLRDQGYRFWLYDGPKKPVDELRLKPGQYMIGFRETSSQTGGAAYCQLEAGQLYSFKITGRQYLPKVGLYALVGDCYLDPEREDSAYREEQKRESGTETKADESEKGWSILKFFKRN